MKYLGKFFEYIKENNGDDFSQSEMEELLLPITDLGVTYHISSKLLTEGEFEGRKIVTIQFYIQDFRKIDIGGWSNRICDNRIWEFMEEIVILKSRIDSDFSTIGFNNISIQFQFIQNSKLENSDLFKIQKIYDELGKRINNSKSDFSNTFSRRLNKDDLKLVITCGGYRESSYTERKWNGFVRGIDFSDYNVDKEITEGKFGDREAIITITVK